MASCASTRLRGTTSSAGLISRCLRNPRTRCLSPRSWTDIGKEPWLFVGLLDDYRADERGQLDRLVLYGVQRRRLAQDKEGSETREEKAKRFYRVDGDLFVLRYAEAITLNVQYVRLSGATASDEEVLVTEVTE